MPLPTKQYRIVYIHRGKARVYQLIVTHGLCDTEIVGHYPKQADARAAAKRHAERVGCTPIILT